MTTTVAVAANREWVEVWLLPLSTIMVALVSGIFGPQWLNRRNARATSQAQAKRDEATAAHVVEQASVSLIKHFRDIVDESEKQIASYEADILRMRAAVTAAELAAVRAERRAQTAEVHSTQAEQRAKEMGVNLEIAGQQIATLREKVAGLEERLRAAGINMDA